MNTDLVLASTPGLEDVQGMWDMDACLRSHHIDCGHNPIGRGCSAYLDTQEG